MSQKSIKIVHICKKNFAESDSALSIPIRKSFMLFWKFFLTRFAAKNLFWGQHDKNGCGLTN